MTETVDQAQAQPPRARAGFIEDGTSLSFVSTSHFEGSRGGASPHGDAYHPFGASRAASAVTS